LKKYRPTCQGDFGAPIVLEFKHRFNLSMTR